MSWVLIGIFGLTGKQVDEVERNNGFTNADINRELNGGFA